MLPFNELLKTTNKIANFEEIVPEKLFKKNFKERSPKVANYEDFIEKLYEKISSLNKRKYKIITADGQAFENLSPGWKSAVILDLLLGYDPLSYLTLEALCPKFHYQFPQRYYVFFCMHAQPTFPISTYTYILDILM